MYELTRPIYLHVITPLHAGSGDNLGVIDMPIQREKHTNFPKIEGSSFKGCIRENIESLYGEKNPIIELLFGSETSDHSGALGFTDARLLLFPVKSVKGVFAWITCPKVINRWIEDLNILKKDAEKLPKYNFNALGRSNCFADDCMTINGKVILEEYSFEINTSGNDERKKLTNQIGEIIGFDVSKKLVILDDDDFTEFVTLSTEVITRTSIDNDTGTVKGTALFTEEYLPSETVMYSLALASKVFMPKEKNNTGINTSEQVMEQVKEIPDHIQIGGNSNIGKGIVKVIQEKPIQEGNNAG